MNEPDFQILQCTNSACRFRFPATSQAKVRLQQCPCCGRPVDAVLGPYASHGLTYPEPAPNGPRLMAMLDNIRSIYNVGAMFRTADGAGLAHLYLCGVTATPEHPRLAKTALGAETTVPWSYHPNGLDLAEDLRRRGYEFWALESGPAAERFFARPAPVPEQPLVLVVGNELAGIDPAILAICHRVMALPMSGKKNSLNVEVAFGIAAYIMRFAAWPERVDGQPFPSI